MFVPNAMHSAMIAQNLAQPIVRHVILTIYYINFYLMDRVYLDVLLSDIMQILVTFVKNVHLLAKRIYLFFIKICERISKIKTK
jgi:hypothetical protein